MDQLIEESRKLMTGEIEFWQAHAEKNAQSLADEALRHVKAADDTARTALTQGMDTAGRWLDASAAARDEMVRRSMTLGQRNLKLWRDAFAPSSPAAAK